jgi:diguanylate cyclase (GGDEF)-like protein/PAS domain S-box-containing protein
MPDTVKHRILCMDDDPGAARLLKRHLERHHCCVVDLASNGEEGLSMLRANFYTVALVDYNMPLLSGIEVTARLAEMEQAPPVIMLTGEGNEQVAVDAMKLGAADYLVKDIEMGYLELLPIVIEQVCQRAQLINDREAILNEARESEERYRKLVELSPDGISVHSDGIFEFINPAGAEILGASSPDELVGRSVLEFVHPDHHQPFIDRLKLLQEADVELPWLEESFLKIDGSAIDVEVTALRFGGDGSSTFQTIFRDITERKNAQRRLEQMANYDPLTGVPNRTFFAEKLNQLMLQAQRENSKFALLFIDLDRFKEANDRHGHYFGDLLLKVVASRLMGCVREADTVARMGGDEFVVIISRIKDKADAARMAERLREEIGKPYQLEGQECELAASIGITLFPDDGATGELQLVRADTAMYRSKKSGRNNYQFYS